MLAWDYGYPRVMSSYYFDVDKINQGPPNMGRNSGYAVSFLKHLPNFKFIPDQIACI